jgi:hypothetical protein
MFALAFEGPVPTKGNEDITPTSLTTLENMLSRRLALISGLWYNSWA